MKPFNLEAAKAGVPLITKDGRTARIVCFDAIRENHGGPILALVKGHKEKFENVVFYNNEGLQSNSCKELDLLINI